MKKLMRIFALSVTALSFSFTLLAASPVSAQDFNWRAPDSIHTDMNQNNKDDGLKKEKPAPPPQKEEKKEWEKKYEELHPKAKEQPAPEKKKKNSLFRDEDEDIEWHRI